MYGIERLMDKQCSILLDAMQASVRDLLGSPDSHHKPLGIAFSGGVDSTLLAVVCGEMGYDVSLLTVGFAKSHDVTFASVVAPEIGIGEDRHHTLTITDPSGILAPCHAMRDLNLPNISWEENIIAFYLLGSLASELDIGRIVTANGIDELFCGYDAYRRALAACDTPSRYDSVVCGIMQQKLQNEQKMFETISGIVSSEFGVDILQPLLSPVFCDAASGVPVFEKITGPDDMLRKHVIRRLAKDVGVPPESYEKQKKALQYGSGIHKALLRLKKRSWRHFSSPPV